MYRTCLLIIILPFTLIGCVQTDQYKTKTRKSLARYQDLGLEVPSIPLSAEKRLLDALGGFGLLEVSEMSYVADRPTVLVIRGLVLLSRETMYGDFVIFKELEEESWDNARVYRRRYDFVEYSKGGSIVTQKLEYASDFICLPDEAFDQALELIGPGWKRKMMKPRKGASVKGRKGQSRNRVIEENPTTNPPPRERGHPL